MERYFLLTTKASADRLTGVFDFVWPTAAAIWNLRWEVTGFLDAVPDATPAALSARFISGSGIHGANLRRACIDTSWEQQQEEFARFLLIELCALYEGWCEGVLQELGIPAATGERLRKQLQFPTRFANGAPSGGVGNALATLTADTSLALSTSLTPVLKRCSKYSGGNLENLLVAYRYFKELRNSLIHSGTGVSAVFAAAEADYSALSPADLGLTEVPEYHPHVAGAAPVLSLRGVVGFGEIILRIICTLDAELSASKRSEPLLKQRWAQIHGPHAVHVPTAHRTRRSRALVHQLGLPRPNGSPQLERWLLGEGLIS